MPTCTVPDCSNDQRLTRPTCKSHTEYDVSDESVVVRCYAQTCYGWRGVGQDVPEAYRMLQEHKRTEHIATREKTNW